MPHRLAFSGSKKWGMGPKSREIWGKNDETWWTTMIKSFGVTIFLRQTHVSSWGSQKDSKPRPKIARLCLPAENVPSEIPCQTHPLTKYDKNILDFRRMSFLCRGIATKTLPSKNHQGQMLHGAGIFTYKTRWFVGFYLSFYIPAPLFAYGKAYQEKWCTCCSFLLADPC